MLNQSRNRKTYIFCARVDLIAGSLFSPNGELYELSVGLLLDWLVLGTVATEPPLLLLLLLAVLVGTLGSCCWWWWLSKKSSWFGWLKLSRAFAGIFSSEDLCASTSSSFVWRLPTSALSLLTLTGSVNYRKVRYKYENGQLRAGCYTGLGAIWRIPSWKLNTGLDGKQTTISARVK